MRILGFTKKWGKLHLELPVEQRPKFTTFRLPRKDSPEGRDWRSGEYVQIWYHPRGKDREGLGIALITDKTYMRFCAIDDSEAVADGFPGGLSEMADWLMQAHHINATLLADQPINKLTLKWKQL